MSQEIPRYSTHFPSTWIAIEDSDDDATPSHPTRINPDTGLSLSSLPPASSSPHTPLRSTQSKYTTYFPSSWALPQPPLPPPKPLALRASSTLKTIKPPPHLLLKDRSVTVTNAEPTTELWTRWRNPQTALLKSKDESEDRLDKFRKSLLENLPQSMSREGSSAWTKDEPPPWHPDSASPRSQTRLENHGINIAKKVTEPLDLCSSDGETAGESEDDSDYNARYGDAPYRARRNDDEYSTRTGATDQRVMI